MADCKVRIVEVRVANFRSLREAAVTLEDITILVGANNVGKTSFLDALYAAMGAGRRLLTQDDVFVEPTESAAPKDRKVIIDVLLRPVDEAGAVLERFPNGSYWTNLWGNGIAQNEELDDIVGFRTTLAWSSAQGEYILQRRFLQEWRPIANWREATEKESLSNALVDPISLHYIDAKRDIEDDVRRQGSFWRRMTDELGLADADVAALEEALSQLNNSIVEKSAVLKHLRTNLSDLRSVVAAGDLGVDITPVARRLRDLSRGVDVTFAAKDSQPFPLARHGMGTRSLASLLVFRAFVSWKQSKAAEAGDRIHPFLALEEPEAHLHPQAQRALFAQIKSIPGQRIVSTHSPYFAGQARLEDIRLFTKRNGSTRVEQLDLGDLTSDERRALERKVVASRGDLLFSRAIVLFEGETEEQTLPTWAESQWGASVHELGFSFVAVDGYHYYPFIYLAEQFGLPWYIFSDGESNVIAEVQKALTKAGRGELNDCANVVAHPHENNLEKQLIEEGYQPEIEEAIDKVFGPDRLTKYIADLNGKDGRKKTKRDYDGAGGRTRAVLDLFGENKTRLAVPVAHTIVGCDDPERRIPECAKRLFTVIAGDFELDIDSEQE